MTKTNFGDVVESLSHVWLFAIPIDYSTPGFPQSFSPGACLTMSIGDTNQQSHPLLPTLFCLQLFPVNCIFQPVSWLLPIR